MKRGLKVVATAIGLIMVAIVVLIQLGLPGPNLICHRGLNSAFEQWKLETTNRDWFPNIEGNGPKSLTLVAPYYPDISVALHDYHYVPGLKPDDPQDLVLMYVKEPSRRKWHGDTHWFRREQGWVVIGPQWESGEEDRWGELSEWIPTDEFMNRLAKTLQFLSENGRSSWTNVVKEHAELLRSIRK